MLNIPEGLPILSAGAHPSPAEGACFMEFNALLAGLPFNDHPSVVDRELGLALQICNDAMSDEGRISLVPLLGRALGLVAPGWATVDDPQMPSFYTPERRDAIGLHNMTTHVLRNTARKIFGQKVRQAWGQEELNEFTTAPLKNLAMNAISKRIERPGGGWYSNTCSCLTCGGPGAETHRTQAITQVVTWLHEAFEEALAFHGWERQTITEVPVEQVLTRVSPIRFATTTN